MILCYCSNKITDSSNLREEELILAQGFKGIQFILPEAVAVAGNIVSAVRTAATQLMLLLLWPRIMVHAMVLSTFSVALPISVNTI